MRKGQYTTIAAKCPFYKKETKAMVFCEGVTKDSVTHLAFANNSAALSYKQKYCRSVNNCQSCKIYKMINQKQPKQTNF